ncbi:hypothetical protein FRACYDRAFT_247915 [Fragilariopsis cylindrus CCMP1102]|uniref:DUF6824 domain-containing protein n=1 Tax=Fragilariopsis cylindrus CCMP1102 TaxID=635003 RepID=A0A1E7EUF4_9STRA|nr:hypothetical protein FRACYDRAFT_247915 [Fragilariopsis cylindrus CCMP1102]|eukprot:OEU09660.1 hypothetical protein FRACYDRAFT_247915 [Fragilariopsis cylindrus CCMP1102]
MQYRCVREGKKTEYKMMNQDSTPDQIAIQSSTMKSINTPRLDDNDNDAHYQADETTAIQPGQYDVLFGRGKIIKAHSGNIMCDQLVKSSYKKYESANKVIKTEMSEQIITAIQESGGRFLRKISTARQHNNNSSSNSDGDHYYYYEEVERNIAREKIAHCFRRLRRKPVSTSSNSTMALFASGTSITSTTSNTSSRTPSFSSSNSYSSIDPVLLQRQQQTKLMPNRLVRVSLSASMNNTSSNGTSMDNNRKSHTLLQRQPELIRRLSQASNNSNESYFNNYDNSSRNNDGHGLSNSENNITTVTNNKNSIDPFDMYICQPELMRRLSQASNNSNESYFNNYDTSSRNNDGRGLSNSGNNITTVTNNKNSIDPFDMYIQLRKKQRGEYQHLQQQQHQQRKQQQETGTGMGTSDSTTTITSMSRSHTFDSMPNIGSLSELTSGCGDIDMILSDDSTDHYGQNTTMINGMHNKSWENPNPDSSFLQEDKNDKNDTTATATTTTSSSCPVEQFKSSFGF